MSQYAHCFMLWLDFITDISIARPDPFAGHITIVTHTPDPKRPGFFRAEYKTK